MPLFGATMDENGVWGKVVVIVDNVGEICAGFVASPGVRDEIVGTGILI